MRVCSAFALAVSALTGLATPATAVRPAATTLTTLAEVEASVTSAVSLTTVPATAQAELTPALPFRSYEGPCLNNRNTTVIDTDCAFGDTHSNVTVVLYGDSEAATWLPALKVLGETYHYKVIAVTRRNCPYAELPLSDYKDAGCAPWKRNAVTYINSLHPSVVIFAEKNVGTAVDPTSPTAPVDAYANDIKVGLREIRAPTKVVLVGMPYFNAGSFGTAPGPCVSTILADDEPLTDCDTPVADAYVDARVTADEHAIHELGVKMVSVRPLFCTPETCPVIIGGNIAYSNEFHTPIWYSTWAAGALGELFARARLNQLG